MQRADGTENVSSNDDGGNRRRYRAPEPERSRRSKAARLIVIVLLLASTFLLVIISAGTSDCSSGRSRLQVIYIVLYVGIAFLVARSRSRGVLPLAAALAVVLFIFAHGLRARLVPSATRTASPTRRSPRT